MMCTSLLYDDGACILMDFASAFPSVSQEFLFESLAAIGIPDRAMSVIRALYTESYCDIRQGIYTVGGFKLEAGVRQGCPLSPLLCATVAEVLMDRIEALSPNTLVKAYADDTALVLRSFQKEAPIIMEIFRDFEEISGLKLNLGKCVTIPLGSSTQENFQKARDQVAPNWSSMPLSDHGLYLGYMVGPGKGTKTWDKPTEKYRQRCKLWEDRGLGLHYQTVAYNTFAASTLGYVGQLEKVPEETLLAESEGLVRTAKGPTAWAVPEDLWRLKEDFGQTASYRNLQLTAKASQVRVRLQVPACRNGHFEQETAQLEQLLEAPWQPVNRLRWDSWYQQSFARTLVSNLREFTEQVCSVKELFRDKDEEDAEAEARDDDDPEDHSPSPPARPPPHKQLQRRTYNKLLAHNAPHPTTRARHKFERWQLHKTHLHPPPEGTTGRHLLPAWQARRAVASLQLLRSLVPPRVCAAVLSTLWNRWCTHARYQQKNAPTNICLFKCRDTA